MLEIELQTLLSHLTSTDYLTNYILNLQFFFSPFITQHVIDKRSTSSQARCWARPPSEPCERVPAVKRCPFLFHDWPQPHLHTSLLWLRGTGRECTRKGFWLCTDERTTGYEAINSLLFSSLLFSSLLFSSLLLLFSSASLLLLFSFNFLVFSFLLSLLSDEALPLKWKLLMSTF